MADASKSSTSVVTAFYLINGKKIDTRLGVAEHKNERGMILGYFVRTGERTVQTVNASSIVSVEVTYERLEDVDSMFGPVRFEAR